MKRIILILCALPIFIFGNIKFVQANSDNNILIHMPAILAAASELEQPPPPPLPPPVEPGWKLLKEKGEFGPRAWHGLLSFKNKLWVMGGQCRWGSPDCSNYTNKDAWSSSDGIHWSLETNNLPINGDFEFNAVIFRDKIWVNVIGYLTFGGNPNGIYNSSDGKAWAKVNTIPVDFNWSDTDPIIVHDNKLWAIGATKIYNSSDGITWSLVTDNIGLQHTDYQYQTLSFNGKLWIIGGYCCLDDRTINVSYIYSSNDGIDWTLLTENAPFKGRSQHSVVVYNDKMWVIGGYLGFGEEANDAWWSRDGINWHEEKNAPRFSARQKPAVTTHLGKIYLVGGYYFSSDVWAYEE